MKKTIKIFLLILLTSSILFSNASFVVMAQSSERHADSITTSDNDLVSYAKSILSNYYFDIDTRTEIFNVQEYTTNEAFSNYLESKVSIKRYITEAADCQKENYKLSFTLLSSEETTEYIRLRILTEATYNYIDLKV